MKLYMGKATFDCDELINELKQHEVQPCHGHMELDSSSEFYDERNRQVKMLSDAGYDDNSVEYRHYKSGEHFDERYMKMLGAQLNVNPLMCWVSETRPGKCVPWHWDINPWEKEHAKLGEVVRFICFLSNPLPGHIFVTAQDAYYMEEQGSIYQYTDIYSWHAGSNVGLEPKYLLTLTSYR